MVARAKMLVKSLSTSIFLINGMCSEARPETHKLRISLSQKFQTGITFDIVLISNQNLTLCFTVFVYIDLQIIKKKCQVKFEIFKLKYFLSL